MMLLPFIVPTVLSTIAWMWILDPAFAPVNWFLRNLHIADPGPSWLGNAHLAMMSLIIVNVWRGLPFYALPCSPACKPFRLSCMRRRRSMAPAPGIASYT